MNTWRKVLVAQVADDPSPDDILQAWQSLTSELVADLDEEVATPEGRKAFYSGDGVARATALHRT